MDAAAEFKANWRDTYKRWVDARAVYAQMCQEAIDLMPPVRDE